MICMHSSISDLSCYMTLYLQNAGQESLTTAILVNLLLPLQGLSPDNLRTVRLLQYSLGETPTFEPTFCNSGRCYNNSHTPNT